jgi:hypothetical protein
MKDSSHLNFSIMVKQRSDEPNDKALERLREFEQERKPVPNNLKDDNKKSKESKKKRDEKDGDDAPDSATDEE